MLKYRCLLVENSIYPTGAFYSALKISELLRKEIHIDWIVRSDVSTEVRGSLAKANIKTHFVPFVEVRRSMLSLLLYIPFLFINSFLISRIIKQRQINLIIINDYYNIIGIGLRLLGYRGKLLTYVRLLPSKQHTVLNQVWIWSAFMVSDRVISVSDAVKRELPRHLKSVRIYDPVRISIAERSRIRSDKRSSSRVRFIYLANYIAAKGHLVALKAFSAALLSNQSIELYFHGSDMGLEKNRRLKESLKSKVVNDRLSSHVFVMDQSDSVEMELHKSDVLLNFSEAESLSMTCLEAAAIGLPVVATRCGGPEEVVMDGKSGILVPVGDLSAMTNAILRLAESESLRHRMGEQGRRLIEERFTSQIFKRRFDQLLTRLT